MLLKHQGVTIDVDQCWDEILIEDVMNLQTVSNNMTLLLQRWMRLPYLDRETAYRCESGPLSRDRVPVFAVCSDSTRYGRPYSCIGDTKQSQERRMGTPLQHISKALRSSGEIRHSCPCDGQRRPGASPANLSGTWKAPARHLSLCTYHGPMHPALGFVPLGYVTTPKCEFTRPKDSLDVRWPTTQPGCRECIPKCCMKVYGIASQTWRRQITAETFHNCCVAHAGGGSHWHDVRVGNPPSPGTCMTTLPLLRHIQTAITTMKSRSISNNFLKSGVPGLALGFLGELETGQGHMHTLQLTRQTRAHYPTLLTLCIAILTE
ncbi:hypothetical protein FB567DRAFT_546735 [Paraphoma chrysanthemicola]|uniref:Uncharacterized protein n=1 Tax=Paraphoma chrysanthemicola TaxID=798071 RepID=A0A8K0RAP8_9PLEO|nr:hypothetical protein FB567DRAFT_546735 [Paraphoma chrysanthemicola]